MNFVKNFNDLIQSFSNIFKIDLILISEITERQHNLNLKLFNDYLIDLNDSYLTVIYKLSNVVISAPLKAEGFGRTVAESMSMKKLIIAYDFGGVKEQISELPEINRVMPNDPNELFIKIKRAINLDQEEYFNLIQPYKDIIIKKFTKKKMIDDTIKIYNSL